MNSLPFVQAGANRPPRRAPALSVHAGRGGYFGGEGLYGRPETSGRPGRQADGPNPRDLLKGLNLDGVVDLAPVDELSQPSAINYDPEGLFKGSTTLQDGHIAKRAITKRVQDGEELESALKAQQEAALEAAQLRRESTAIPATTEDLVDFFLTVEAEDMEYFVAKCRPQLTDAFFAILDGRVGQLRFLGDDQQQEDKDRLDELLGLRSFVQQFLAAQDSVTKGVLSVTERMKKLLMAKDKKQMILDMAAANEIDVALLTLLQENIASAQAAGQVDAANFMDKVKTACAKYVIVPQASEEATVRAALEQEKKAAPSMPSLILPYQS